MSYTVVLDIDRDYTFDNVLDNISNYVLDANWNYGGVTFGGQVGTYAEMLPPSRSTIRLLDNVGALNLSNPSASYYNKLKKGVLVRLSHDATQLFEHRIVRISSTSLLQDGSRYVTLECCDPTENWFSSNYIARLQKTVRIDEIIADTLSDVTLPYPYPISGAVAGLATVGVSKVGNYLNFVDLEQARTTLDYAGDIESEDTSVTAHLAKHLRAEGGGRLFWSRDAKVRFHDRYFDFTSQNPSSISLDDTNLIEYQTANGDALFNSIATHYRVRQLGTPLTKIAEATNLPMKITQGSYRNFTLRFRDFSGNDLQVASDDVLTPVVGVDVICYDAESSGVVDNNFVAVGVDKIGAQEIRFSVNNNSAYGDPRSKDRWIHTLQVRGTPLYSHDRQSIALSDSASILANGKYSLELNYDVIHDADFATSLTRYLLNRYKLNAEYITSLMFVAWEGNINTLKLIDIGTLLNITSSVGILSGEYVVIGQEWSISADDSVQSIVTLYVKPTLREPVAVVGRAIVGTTSATVAL